MRNSALRFLLILLALIPLAARSQSYSFLSYSTSQGLPQSQVTSITQDKDGYLWIGTISGLAKFNGKRFTNFSTENGLVNNRITCLSLIGDKLWTGHEGGISVLTNDKAVGWQFSVEDRTMNVTDVVEFNGAIVASTNGAGLCIIRDGKMHKAALPDEFANRCRDLLIVGKDLFIATLNGVYKTTDLKHFTKANAFGNRDISSFARRGKKVIVSTYDAGLFSSDLQLSKRDSIPLREKDYIILQAFVDSKGNTWLTSPYGVIRINPQGKQLIIKETNGLPIAAINRLFEDREGIIWMGTNGKGLLRFTGEKFVYFNHTNGFPSDLILSSISRSGDDYYFGSYDKGLFHMDKQGKTTEIKSPDNRTWTIWSLAYDNDGHLWIGSGDGLSIYRDNTQVGKIDSKVNRTKITVIRKYDNKRLLAGGSDGISWIVGDKMIPIDFNIDFQKTIGTVRDFTLFNGRILCASDKGLFDIDPWKRSYNRIKFFSSGAKSLVVDDDNRVWIGTENGLILYDGIAFTNLKIGSSSGDRFINFQVKIDDYIYIGTNNGLYVFNAKNEKPYVVRHYGIHDGLINLETNINSAFYDDQYLWFGTAEGLVRFDLHEAELTNSDQSRPMINISGILLNYQPFNYSEYAVKMEKNGLPAALKLPYNKNNITIDLDGLLLSDPEGLRYQFWLEGQDENWSPLLSNPSIVLSNINDGDYTLHVKTVNQMGQASREYTLPISITPPFWGTWWFYTIVLIIVLLGIRMYFQVQIKRERDRNYQENLENRTRLQALEQQSLNASMNRHFIFNSLNSIQYFINTQDRLSANRYLTNFAKLIRKNLDSAAENDNVVSLDQELERLELYLSLECMRFKDRFTYAINSRGIETDQILVPGMLLQPFVENSIIHGILPDESKPGRIEVNLRIVDSVLEITIDDNGIGIDFSLNRKKVLEGGDHKSQGMEITSKRIDLIRTMWKKDYELQGPFQVTNSDHSIKGTRVLIKIPVENLEISV